MSDDEKYIKSLMDVDVIGYFYDCIQKLIDDNETLDKKIIFASLIDAAWTVGLHAEDESCGTLTRKELDKISETMRALSMASHDLAKKYIKPIDKIEDLEDLPK